MKATPQPGTAPSRRAFQLSGPTVRLDPRTHAVRGDLADVRLAEYVFAPHYAAPVLRTLRQATCLRVARERTSEVMADLDAGTRFEVLEVAGGLAWGLAAEKGLAGYVDADLLDEAA